MRLIIGGLLLIGIAVAFVSMAAVHWPLYTSLVIGSFVVPCFIGKLIRWGLDSQNVES